MTKKKLEKKDWMLIGTTIIAIGGIAWGVIETQLQKYGVISIKTVYTPPLAAVPQIRPDLERLANTKPAAELYIEPPKMFQREPVLVPPHISQWMPVPPTLKEYHRITQTGIKIE